MSAEPRLLDRLPRTPVEYLAMLHAWGRTLVGVGGIAFATLFMFMQLGFLGAVERTAVSVTERFSADLYLISTRHQFLAAPDRFPRGRLSQALNDPAVVEAEPLYVDYIYLLRPQADDNAKLLVLGISEAAGRMIAIPELQPHLEPLNKGLRALVDSEVRAKYEPVTPGTDVSIEGRTTRVLGRFRLGTGFFGDGALLVGDQSFSILKQGYPLSEVQLGLIRLKPGSRPGDVAARLRKSLPSDVRVVTWQGLQDIQLRRWRRDTSLGNIFIMGTALGFLVGFIVLYQVLATNVSQLLPQFATLKAIGYSDLHLHGMVLRQSCLFGVVGFVPGFLASLGVYHLVYTLSKLPVHMTGARALFVGGICLVICVLSGAIALTRLERADPADLY